MHSLSAFHGLQAEIFTLKRNCASMGSVCVLVCCPDQSTPAVSRIVEENAHAVLILDGYPVSPGHSLLIPKRHVGSFFDATEVERAALLALLARAKELVAQQHRPDGYNIGINDGAAAGQTMPHLHIHLIPRYSGDQADPRGGVRWLMPQKADYWTGR